MNENLKIRKRKIIKIEDKINLIRQIESGKKKCEVGKEFGLVSSTIQSIWKNRQNILQSYKEHRLNVKRKPKLCKPGQNEIDQALIEWFNKQRAANSLVSGPTLRNKAEEFAREMHYCEFVCTKSWLDRFKFRHNISLYGNGKAIANDEDSSGESNHFNTTNNDELINNSNCDDFGPTKVLSSNSAKGSESAITYEQDEAVKEEVAKHSLSSGDLCSDLDDDDSSQTEPATIYRALEAIRTLKRYYESNENAQIIAALHTIKADLDQTYWTELRQVMCKFNHCNSADPNGDQDNMSDISN